MSISYFFSPINYAKNCHSPKWCTYRIYLTEKSSMCNILVYVYNKKYRQHQTKVVLKYYNDCERNISCDKLFCMYT